MSRLSDAFSGFLIACFLSSSGAVDACHQPDINEVKEEFGRLLKGYKGPEYAEKPDLHFNFWARLGLQGALFCKGTDVGLVQDLIEEVGERLAGAAQEYGKGWQTF